MAASLPVALEPSVTSSEAVVEVEESGEYKKRCQLAAPFLSFTFLTHAMYLLFRGVVECPEELQQHFCALISKVYCVRLGLTVTTTLYFAIWHAIFACKPGISEGKCLAQWSTHVLLIGTCGLCLEGVEAASSLAPTCWFLSCLAVTTLFAFIDSVLLGPYHWSVLQISICVVSQCCAYGLALWYTGVALNISMPGNFAGPFDILPQAAMAATALGLSKRELWSKEPQYDCNYEQAPPARQQQPQEGVQAHPAAVAVGRPAQPRSSTGSHRVQSIMDQLRRSSTF
eukprot:TRINITY_DN100740_c0_g1_i1.p1 TRINITY_DN100740_c0_g1~~TRINITY_DN100740_c0_g1_i1.p1  ORF type:complete len:285 (-),score=28.95 TRINITY_DN100740_c0_g1_i1:144-998(-)